MQFDTTGKGGLDIPERTRTQRDQVPLTSIIRDGRRILVTPELAQRIVAECYYEPQDYRGNSPRHVALLASEMSHGRFSGGTQIHFGKVGDRLYLVDGNHRIRAVAESGKTVEFSLLVDETANKKSLGPLYWRHDFIQRKRGMLVAAQVAGESDMQQAHLASAIAAVPLIVGGFARGTRVANHPKMLEMASPDARLAAFRPWQKFAEQYFEAISQAPTAWQHRLKRVGYVAVAMATFKYQPDRAKEFWSGLAADDGLRKGDPRKLLIRHMTETSLKGGAVSSNESWMAAALCWNAHFEGRQLTVLKLAAQNFYIAGTPFERKFIKRDAT